MNRLYRVRVRPRSAWRTPWQADTVSGALCWLCARIEDERILREEIIEPMLVGQPPFVLSDAFPGELLPFPLAARLADWPAEARKMVKRAKWIRPEAFRQALAGRPLNLSDVVMVSPVVEYEQMRNTLDRLTGTTGGTGTLYSLPESWLNVGSPALGEANWYSIYVRVQAATASLLSYLLEALAQIGFGADTSTGRGAFDFPSGTAELEPVDWLDPAPVEADGMITLSTFQPGPTDPVHGLWESFTKFGKLGPGFGLTDVRKNPLLLFRPGACFAGPPRPFLGRAVPMDELLPAAVATALDARGIRVVHPAFALAVPAVLRLQ